MSHVATCPSDDHLFHGAPSEVDDAESQEFISEVVTLDALNRAATAIEAAAEATSNLEDGCSKVFDMIDAMRGSIDVDPSPSCPEKTAKYLTAKALTAINEAKQAWNEADIKDRGRFSTMPPKLPITNARTALVLAETRIMGALMEAYRA